MSVIGDLRGGLKTNLSTIDGVNVSKYALSNPVGPIIHLWPTNVVYHRAMQMGLKEVSFRVEAAVPFTTDQGPQAMLDKWIDAEGSDSVRAAVESDKTLGGLCDTLQVEAMNMYEVSVTADNQARLTAAWSVTVYLGST